MKTIFRVVAWLLLVAIIVLSIVPPYYRPVTAMPHNIEHSGIFLAAGLAFGLGYERRHTFQAVALAIFAALIEVCQLSIPGRHARLSDFLIDAVSVCIAVGLAAIIVRAKGYIAAPRAPIR